MPLQDIINVALERIEHIAKTETIFGKSISVGDVTLIPVSRVSIGFAAGGADKGDKDGSGTGTGGGVSVTPVAFISIANGDIRIHSISDGEFDIEKLIAMAPDAIKKAACFFKKKSKRDRNASASEDKNDSNGSKDFDVSSDSERDRNLSGNSGAV